MMSAYMVDRGHVQYLVDAAMSRRINDSGAFRWHHNGSGKSLPAGDY